jgi:hypothetical protein
LISRLAQYPQICIDPWPANLKQTRWKAENDMLAPFIKQMTEFNHGTWAISTAALNAGPINATGV